MRGEEGAFGGPIVTYVVALGVRTVNRPLQLHYYHNPRRYC